jgi:hypothetical protein
MIILFWSFQMTFANDIQKIARTKYLEERVDKAVKAALLAEKAAIEGQRAIAYLKANGTTGVQTGSPSNNSLTTDIDSDFQDDLEYNDKDLQNFDPEKDAEKDNDSEENTDKSASANLENSGNRSAKDIIDNSNETDGDGNRTDTNASKSSGNARKEKKYRNVTGKEYHSGKNVAVNLDGSQRKPNGWEQPGTPGVDPSYEAGKVWAFPPYGFSNSFYEGLIPGNLIPASAQFVAVDGTGASNLVTSLSPTPGDTMFLTSDPAPEVGDTVGSIGGTGYAFNAYSPGGTVSTGYGIQDCGLDAGDTAACAAPEPILSNWPTAGFFVLAFSNGNYTPSQYDTEVPANWANGGGRVNFDLGSGRYAIMEPTVDGGQILYETAGAPPNTTAKTGSIATYFRPNGTVGEYVPAAQVELYKFLSGS